MANCTFCGKALPERPQTYVEQPNVAASRTDLARACPECASGFPTRFTVG